MKIGENETEDSWSLRGRRKKMRRKLKIKALSIG